MMTQARWSLRCLLLWCFLMVGQLAAPSTDVVCAAELPEAFQRSIQPFLTQYCVECHGETSAEGGLRLDSPKSLQEAASIKTWERILRRLDRREMPPADSDQPTERGREAAMLSIERMLGNWNDSTAADEVVMRRLTRTEYAHTVSDLLGIRFEAKDMFPKDDAPFGFSNVGESLHISPVLMRAYLDAADIALDEALWFEPKPEYYRRKFDQKEQLGYTEKQRLLLNGAGFGLHNGHMVIRSYWSRHELSDQRIDLETPGVYRVKLKIYSIRSPDEKAKIELQVGNYTKRDTIRRIGFYNLPNEDPAHVLEEEIYLHPDDTIKFIWFNGKSHNNAAAKARLEGLPYDGPGVVVEWVEVEGPLFLEEGWPKRSHRLAVGSKEPQDLTAEDVPEIVRSFAARAFRRPPEDSDILPIAKYVQEELAAGATFEEAIRVGLKMILCSPKFLFLSEPGDQLDNYALASRLSYFLWSSMPDEALFELAARGELSDPEVLRSQAKRMLLDPKANRFIENFTDQWLALDQIGEMQPDSEIYREYNEELEDSLAAETYHFFGEVLRNNRSVDNFLDSDFLVLNERLARHYGVEGVEGPEFRVVDKPDGSQRGGLLTQAGILNVTSNGTTTSPIIRGVWVLERILGATLSPPPDDIPIVVPDIRGAKTIREQLAKHRSVESCNVCHRQIDPLGFALESFDVIGKHRTHYRVRKGPAGKGGWYGEGPEVDASGRLTTGESFSDIGQLKQILLSTRRTDFHRCLTEKLMTYALGRPLAWSDRATIGTLALRLSQSEHGLQDLILDIVSTEQFSRP